MAALEIINGRTFSFGIIPATECVGVQVAIASVIGEPLFKAVMTSDKAAKGKVTLADLGPVAVGLMMTRLSEMGSDKLLQVMNVVFKYVSCDGKRIILDECFTGRPREMWQVFLAALKVNFSDFFSELHFDSSSTPVISK